MRYMQSFLSIVIPTLNEEKYLPNLLQCIKAQKLNDYEIIVSDGNSIDKTIKIAKKYGCKVVSSKISSPAHQRNKGAAVAKGNIILFLDADSLVPDDFFISILAEFSKKDLDVASFFYNFNSKKMVYKIMTFWSNLNIKLIYRLHPLSAGAGILVKKKFHKKINGFDESLFIAEDHLYAKSIVQANGTYGLLRSKPILFNIRRFEKEGTLKVLLKWSYSIVYYLIFGPIKKKIIEYKFGEY